MFTSIEMRGTFVGPDGLREPCVNMLVHEHFLTIKLDGLKLAALSCTPEHLEELALGRLCTEGIIRTVDDVRKLEISRDGGKAEVFLFTGTSPAASLSSPLAKSPAASLLSPSAESPAESPSLLAAESPLSPPATLSSPPEKSPEESPAASASECRRLDSHSLQGACVSCQLLPAVSISPVRRGLEKLPPVMVDEGAVFRLARRFSEDSVLHRITNGAHSSYLCLPDGTIEGFEDIGRHNALDKAVGRMLLLRAAPERCILYTTGRVNSDMAKKVVMARVPVLVSKSLPTDLGVKTAAEYGLRLLCRAWPDSFVSYDKEE